MYRLLNKVANSGKGYTGMNPVQTLLNDFRKAGVRVYLESGKILASPSALLTDDLRRRSARLRVELVNLLSRQPLSDDQIQAIADRAHDDPPDFDGTRTLSRESALVNIEGRWVALDPQAIEVSRVWNAAVAEKHAQRFHVEPKKSKKAKPAGPGQLKLFIPEGGSQ